MLDYNYALNHKKSYGNMNLKPVIFFLACTFKVRGINYLTVQQNYKNVYL